MIKAHTIGNKYEATQDLDVRDIAKLIRKDLKAAGIKASVRIERYSTHSTIQVRITGIPKSMDLASLVAWQPHVSINSDGWWRPTDDGLVEQVRAIVEAYNFNDSYGMTDYYHVRFYARVTMDENLRCAAEAAAEARRVAQDASQAEIVALPVRETEPAQVELMRLLGAE